jgi:hypothetical protein
MGVVIGYHTRYGKSALHGLDRYSLPISLLGSW